MALPLAKRRKLNHEETPNLLARSRSSTRLQIGHYPLSFSWETPLILSSYTTLIFYSILTIVTLYLLYLGFTTIQLEIHDRIAQHMLDLENNMAQCRQQYQQNQCYDMVTSPILMKYCEGCTCMQKNPYVVKRTDIAARVFGELINSFFDGLTLKTMFALSLLVFGSVLVSFSL